MNGHLNNTGAEGSTADRYGKGPAVRLIINADDLGRDAAPLSRNRVTKLVFDLYPTSYRFRKGHSIHLALAGADADHFANPPGRAPEVRYHRNASCPSHVILPVMPVEQEAR